VDAQGEPLLESYVKPTRPIPPDAMAIHGITDAMVADAPTIIELEPDIRRAIQDRAVIVYNAEFDMRLLRQSSAACACNINWREMPRRWLCAMQAYAEYRGEPGRTYGEYRWHKLEAAARNEGIPVERAHSALADCLTTWRLVRRLAETGE
jgi:DNA polymerase-3 subunit epsilon